VAAQHRCMMSVGVAVVTSGHLCRLSVSPAGTLET
jgi:hypothetical protein